MPGDLQCVKSVISVISLRTCPQLIPEERQRGARSSGDGFAGQRDRRDNHRTSRCRTATSVEPCRRVRWLFRPPPERPGTALSGSYAWGGVHSAQSAQSALLGIERKGAMYAGEPQGSGKGNFLTFSPTHSQAVPKFHPISTIIGPCLTPQGIFRVLARN
jgi:hypothetical protein